MVSIIAAGTVGFGTSPTYGQCNTEGCGCSTDAGCDDGIDCTHNQCYLGFCRFNPLDAACNDPLFCNGVETCDPAVGDPVTGCVPGTPPCIGNSCAEAAGMCTCTVDANCDDGLFCNGAEACIVDGAGGTCVYGTDPCDDTIACTTDSCDEAMGQCTNTPVDSVCNDHQYCNGSETCDKSMGCVGGTPPCDDGLACTADTCDEITDICTFTNTCDDGIECTVNRCSFLTGQCQFSRFDLNCDDGLFCNGAEKCDPATGDPVTGCNPGTPPNCSDGIVCTIDACDTVTDSCVSTPDDLACDDGIPCTVDICDPVNGCQHTPVDSLCNNHQYCDGVETCDVALGCVNGTIPCNDGIACTADTCDETTDLCSNTSTCDDGVGCTTDICTMQGFCLFEIDLGSCDDGVFCNGSETCNPATGCIPGTPPLCKDGVACTIDTCDAATDRCLNTPNDLACVDNFPCTTGTCDPVNGCQQTLQDSVCDDGLFCNGAETCNATVGCVGGAAPCNDGRACTADTCDETADKCTFTNTCDDHNPCSNDICSAFGICVFQVGPRFCDDGVFCNGMETCDPAIGCMPGTPRSCNDSIPCTIDSCDEAMNQCIHTPVDGMCDDSLYCNGVETCDVGLGCVSGAAPCDDGRNCTADTCDEGADTCAFVDTCDDGRICTVDVCSDSGLCLFSYSDAVCDDGIACTIDTCNTVRDSCVHTDNCDDGLACTIDTCDTANDVCVNTTNCDDLIGCTIDSCTPSGCVHTEDNTVCDDAVGCTFDQCSIAFAGCRNLSDDGYCDDTLFCNGAETCDTATGDPITGCLPAGDPCPGRMCNETADLCGLCIDDTGCPAGKMCCNGFCAACCTNNDCVAPTTCCLGACKLDCRGIDPLVK